MADENTTEDRHLNRARTLLAEVKAEPDSTGKEAVLADALAAAETTGFGVGYSRATRTVPEPEVEAVERHWDVANDLAPASDPQHGETVGLFAQALAEAEARGARSTKGGIRVLRVIEYVYPDADRMAKDMAMWSVQGQTRQGGTWIRSVALPPEVLG